MKNPLKLVTIILSSVLALTATGTVVSIATSYTKDETDALVLQLEQTAEKNKSDLQSKIDELIANYEAKDAELLQLIEENEQALANLTAEYQAKAEELNAQGQANAQALATLRSKYEAQVQELKDKDLATDQAIADLDAKYLAEVEKLVASDTANAQALATLKNEYETNINKINTDIENLTDTIELNKSELNSSITALQTKYDSKLAEINSLITTLQNTDTTNAEVIEALTNRVIELEKGLIITAVEFNENGDLVITFADGSSQVVEAPKTHKHSFGDWILFSTESVFCEELLYYRVCSSCNNIEWKKGSYADHVWKETITPPTCLKQGYTTYTCHCGDSYISDYVDALGHTCDDSNKCSTCDLIVTDSLTFNLLSNDTYEVEAKDKNNLPLNIVIPSSYNEKAVTSIASSAFEGSSCLSAIKIPNSVTSIGNYAFNSCASLTSVVIGDSVNSIGSSAFGGCTSLANIQVDENNPYYKSTDGNLYSKDGGTLIQYAIGKIQPSFTIPNGVTSVGNYAFSGCTSLNSIVISNSVTYIGDYAFIGCYKLVEVVSKSSYITVEKDSSSNGYVSYYALAVYNSDDAFVTKLSTNENGYVTYTYGEEIILVGYVGSQTNLVLPSSITKIYRFAFYNNNSITSVVIDESVTLIDDYAFYKCGALASAVIGNSVTSIGSRVFSSCSSLTSITFEDDSTWYRTISSINWNNKTDGEQTSVTNSSTNVSYFTSIYIDYCWYKN